ncbi:MAG: acetylornithine deacetylase, partial [Rhodobacteraceae bacterium]|nr:acetylornithine deacetylase [Paracoccaceae bacterium]
ILETLVSYPTVSNSSNLDLVSWIYDYLEGYNIDCHLDYNSDGTKASIYALIGPEEPDGVILSGHTDVVPVVGQKWQTDPWKLTENDGKLYGRGTCDMKGFLANVLAMIPEMTEVELKRPIQLAFSRDEEVGCIGAPPMISKIRDQLPPAKLAIIGEPSMLKVVTGHKGGTAISVHVRGFEVHSSIMHQGVSAIMYAAKLIEWANQRNKENSEKRKDSITSQFVPPYTTLHVGKIKGGTAQNITAKDCRFFVEIRCVPGEEPEKWVSEFQQYAVQLESEMKKVNEDTGINTGNWFNVPPLKPETNGAAEEMARRITGDNSINVVSYATEAGQFQEKGYSAVVCGPGSIEQAHGADEFISISQLEAGERFIGKIIRELT